MKGKVLKGLCVLVAMGTLVFVGCAVKKPAPSAPRRRAKQIGYTGTKKDAAKGLNIHMTDSSYTGYCGATFSLLSGSAKVVTKDGSQTVRELKPGETYTLTLGYIVVVEEGEAECGGDSFKIKNSKFMCK